MMKKAFLVGINDYSPKGTGGPDLRGCVNDVTDMANTLSVLGFVPASPKSMMIATDRRATRKAILEGIGWLVEGAKPGDILAFYYSGHGSQVIDLNSEEPDGKDETICPHDFVSAGMITDDDLQAAIGSIPDGVTLEVILDSCHSGTGTRELASLAASPAELNVAYRYVEPPVDWGFFIDSDPSMPTRGIMRHKRAVKAAVAVPMGHVLWAGCRNNQTSAETMIGGRYRGVFTYTFCKVLRGAGADISRKQLGSQVSRDIKAMGQSQVPQLEGSAKAIAAKAFS